MISFMLGGYAATGLTLNTASFISCADGCHGFALECWIMCGMKRGNCEVDVFYKVIKTRPDIEPV